ncbi:hypothetical protein HRbin14_01541 [bacterium HR14]|nr:hypothetical protein HRbin14_01541 [bacterium HR14]
MGGDERNGGGAFVVFTHFQPNHAVFHHVNPPDAVLPCNFVERLHQGERLHRLPIQRNGNALLKGESNLLWGVGRFLGALGPFINLFWRGVVGVFEPSAFNRAPPEVLVDAPDFFGALVDGHAALAGVFDLFGAGHVALAHGGDNGHLGHQRAEDKLDAELVVAFARAAVCEGVHAGKRLRHLHGFLRNQRAGNRRAERIALIIGIRLHRGHAVVASELGAGVHRVMLGAQNLGAFARVDNIFTGLSHIHRDGHHMVKPVLFAQEGDTHGGIQPA